LRLDNPLFMVYNGSIKICKGGYPMKKLLSILLALAIMVGMAAAGAVSAGAEEDTEITAGVMFAEPLADEDGSAIPDWIFLRVMGGWFGGVLCVASVGNFFFSLLIVSIYVVGVAGGLFSYEELTIVPTVLVSIFIGIGALPASLYASNLLFDPLVFLMGVVLIFFSIFDVVIPI